MTKKQKTLLYRILVAAVLFVPVYLISEGIVKADLPRWALFCLFLIPYLTVGYDILRKAALGIKNKKVFDECFLMTVATVGAIALGEYGEGVAVMLLYQVGELFQSVAVGKSRRSISALMDIRPDYANVETSDQVDILRKNSCDIAQGFYYDKPLPVREFEKRLEQHVYSDKT